MGSEKIVSWISINLSPFEQLIEICFVFGSIARGSQNPGDCDLLIVSKADSSKKDWFFLRQELNGMKQSFNHKFCLELSILLMSSREYQQEIDEIEIRFAPRIIIFLAENRF
ncbi:MAG: nucleotidyltransferase domain-containing protein [Leptolyngbyaceae cyanobacterium]